MTDKCVECGAQLTRTPYRHVTLVGRYIVYDWNREQDKCHNGHVDMTTDDLLQYERRAALMVALWRGVYDDAEIIFVRKAVGVGKAEWQEWEALGLEEALTRLFAKLFDECGPEMCADALLSQDISIA